MDTTRLFSAKNQRSATGRATERREEQERFAEEFRAETDWGLRDGRPGLLNPFQTREDERLIQQHSTGTDFSKYQEIPVQTSHELVWIDSFEDCDAPKLLQRNTHLLQYLTPTPVQKYLIPAILQGNDVIACAQTGSGKTAAYLFPIVQKMIQSGPPAYSPQKSARPVAAVLSPTRELAIQIYEEARKLTFRSGINVAVVYGGADPRVQCHALDAGVDLLVGTPGRLIDFMCRGIISLAQVQYLVMDEADRMLDMGFEPQVRQILEGLRLQVQTVMCSATFPQEVKQLATKYTRNCIFLSLGRTGSATEYVTQEAYYVESRKKVILLHELLQQIHGLVLIFVQMKRDADALAQVLYRLGYEGGCIHGGRGQMERERALQAFKDGSRPILVATDVASRGLDIPNVAAVLNFDSPGSIDDYVHRIGRTGRAGRDGRAITFVGPKDVNFARELYRLFKETQTPVPDWMEDMWNPQLRSPQGW